jgi:DNA-binding response OmpR family regulator
VARRRRRLTGHDHHAIHDTEAFSCETTVVGRGDPHRGEDQVAEGRRTVLVVDDDPDVLLLCRVNLEFEGYRVIEATNGEDALAKVATERPDVVLLDVMLSRLDGWQVLERLKADPRTHDLPVVLVTAKVQEDDQIRGWSTGAAEYITKPFSPLALSRTLHDVLTTDPEEEERRRRLVLEKLHFDPR